MITFHSGTTPTSVKPSAPKLTAKDKQRLEAGIGELAAIDRKFSEIDDLRDIIRESARAYAAGEISLAQSVSLAGIEPTRVPEVRGALRTGCRSLQKQIVLSLAPLVTAHREHIVADLLGRCSEMEKLERQTCSTIGIDAEQWRPSGLLLALIEQHTRAKRDAAGIISRSDLTRLAQAVGIEIPSVPEADPLADPLADLEVSDGEIAEAVYSGTLE